MREIIDGLRMAPKTCTWELTLRCNLNCGHCGSRAGKARPNEMPRDVMLRVTRELAAMGCRRLSLSGGEPTLSPHWADIAQLGASLGIRMNMITNGAAGGRELVQRAKDAGLAALGVSLDGLEAAHDKNRGAPGLFGRVMGLIDECNAVGLPVGVITTIWKGNVEALEQMHDLIAGRVYVWQVQLGAAMGNLADHRDQQVAPEDLLEIVPALARLVRRGKVRIHVGDNIGYYGPYEEILRTRRTTPVPCWIGCYAGCRHMGIEADGGVKGCLSIQASRATEGNLQHESLSDIWWKKDAFAYNRQFKLDDLGGFCRTCEHASICRGGCLSMRTCEGGRDNPFCYHRVATLAERKAQRSRPRYVPMMVAPAAIMALMGIGCGGESVVEESSQPDAATDAHQGQDAGLDAVDKYGIEDPDAAVDYYGMPAEAGPDVTPGDAYGIADPDATVDYYGLPAEAGPDVTPGDAYGIADPDATVDYYGLPADADIEAADDYGIPNPDGGPEAGDKYGMP